MFSVDHERQVKDNMHTLFYLPEIHRHPNWGIETLYLLLLSGSERITSKRKKVLLFVLFPGFVFWGLVFLQ